MRAGRAQTRNPDGVSARWCVPEPVQCSRVVLGGQPRQPVAQQRPGLPSVARASGALWSGVQPDRTHPAARCWANQHIQRLRRTVHSSCGRGFRQIKPDRTQKMEPRLVHCTHPLPSIISGQGLGNGQGDPFHRIGARWTNRFAKNSLNSRSICSGAMPMPVSCTET